MAVCGPLGAAWERVDHPSRGKPRTLFEDVGCKGPAALRALRAQARQRAAQLRRDLLTGLLQLAPHGLLEERDCRSHEGPGRLHSPGRATSHITPQKCLMTQWKGPRICY